jgi:hypothetical protein
MRFHDFHLAGYSVADFGATIILDLIHDRPDRGREVSRIKFSEVAAYHFVHTGSSIIVDITEVPVDELLRKVGDDLAEWWRLYGGYIHWCDDRPAYVAGLEREGYRAWVIDSAVGFEGFVIARSIE